MIFSVAEFRNELSETRIQKQKLAQAIEVPPCYVTQYANGTRKPTDKIACRITFVFTFIRSAEMANGGFALSNANIKLLRRKIREMEKSTVASIRLSPSAAPEQQPAVEQETAACAN